MEIDIRGEQIVRKRCSATYKIMTIGNGTEAMAIVSTSVGHRCDLISSERFVDGAFETDLLSESGDKNLFSEVVDPSWVPPKVNVCS